MAVQLSIRVEDAFRQRLRRAAADENRTLQDFVHAALADALEQRATTERARLQSIRDELGAALRSGAYADYVAAIDDPDLRTE